MCGIFFTNIDNHQSKEYGFFEKIIHRGPESSFFYKKDKNCYGFHRLGIVHPNSKYNQPFLYDDFVVMCNGEIYNWTSLIEEYELPSKEQMSSDCEVIGLLYQKLDRDFHKLLTLLDGEFAVFLHDLKESKIYAARDFMGIRPLYYSVSDNGLKIASEIKCFDINSVVNHILPKTVYTFDIKDRIVNSVNIKKYWNFPKYTQDIETEDNIVDNIYNILSESVKSRITESERPVGCLLSGGVDSSIIVSLVSKINPNIQCFTIGLENSPDVKAAKKVAEFLGVKLHIIPFDIENGINSIPKVIYHLETYDITTVRASTPQYLIAKWICENTDIKVILSGEGSDEIFSGYIYSKLAPSPDELWKDGVRLLSELYLFDCLRTDRTISSAGLEVRVPFLNKKLVEYVLQLNPVVRMCDDKIEKYILRKMADKYNLLPKEIIYRPKEAFSDAVSDDKTTWFKSIQTKIFPLKEAEWYKNLFDKYYPGQSHILPHYWLPKWTDAQDPSATLLKVYKK